MRPEQYNRLPQYAQREIHRLEASVEYWKRRAWNPDREETDTAVDHGWDTNLGRRLEYLLDGQRIRFLLSGGYEVTAAVKDDRLDVYLASVSARYQLATLPRATNHIKIGVV